MFRDKQHYGSILNIDTLIVSHTKKKKLLVVNELKHNHKIKRVTYSFKTDII